jgi:phospholipase/carboxylesterase
MQTVWFDRQAMSYSAPEDKAGVARSVEQIDREIDKLVAANIPLNRIAVAGFSMGGCLALHVGYGSGRYAGKLAAVAALSTFLAEDSGLIAAAEKRIQEAASGATEPPLFMAHGEADPMVNPQWAAQTRQRLANIGSSPRKCRPVQRPWS